MFKLFKPKNRFINEELIFDHLKDGFDIFLKKVNAYFSQHPDRKKKFKNELYYLNNKLNSIGDAEKMIYSIIPYPFVLRLDHRKVEVFRDEDAEMFYVYLAGKKLYYHKGFKNVEDVQKSFTYITAEQDIESPHRYLDDFFYVNSGDVAADLGAAEGNFSLLIIDKVRELFIIESDPAWMDALHKTFEPWKNKVHIINKLAGDQTTADTITLDDVFTKMDPDVIKMDIEGAELKVLQNTKLITRAKNIKMAITTYHSAADAENIKTLLENKNFKTKFSDRFMLFVYDNLTPPYFRHGLIKAVK